MGKRANLPDTDLYQSTAVSLYDRFPAPDFSHVLTLINSAKPSRGVSFDVGCGTGTLIHHLSASGWQASGCDPSPPMVAFAAAKNQNSHIQLATATNFKLAEPVDLITCTFDVLNHLPSLADVESFFELAFRSLKEGGVLIFDTVTPDDIQRNWPGYAHIESREQEFIAIRGEQTAEHTGRLYYDFFTKLPNGCYSRSTEIHTLRALPLIWTKTALKQLGFRKISHLDASNSMKPKLKTVRWLFSATKALS